MKVKPILGMWKKMFLIVRVLIYNAEYAPYPWYVNSENSG
jgi:hypothetical protein